MPQGSALKDNEDEMDAFKLYEHISATGSMNYLMPTDRNETHEECHGATAEPSNDHLQAGASRRSSYTPQFAAESPLILSRMKNHTSPSAFTTTDGSTHHAQLGNPDSADVKNEETGGLDLTLARPVPELQNTLPLPAKSALIPSGVHFAQQGVKRKRELKAGEVDFTQTTIAFPMPEPVGIQPLKPTALSGQDGVRATNKRCYKCHGREETLQNQLIQCAQCSSSWHRQCCTPVVPDDAMQRPMWSCPDCVNADDLWNQLPTPAESQRQREIERLRRKMLSALPLDVVPPKLELVGFSAGDAPRAMRSEYFYNKKKTEVLNLLSFCDQLRPSLLVDILVSVSNKHPELPIFDSPDWQSRFPGMRQPVPVLIKPRRRADRPRHGHTINPKAKIKIKTGKRIIKPPVTIEVVADAIPGEEEEEEEEEALPPAWPKPGEGLYAKLLPETEDRQFLVDQNDEEAFSHFAVDKMGRQIVEPALG